VICNFTDEITYGSPIGDMLNCTEGIANEIKWVFFFFCTHVWFVMPSVNLLKRDSLTDQKLPTSIFPNDVPSVTPSVK
jgi:hypothetical protein